MTRASDAIPCRTALRLNRSQGQGIHAARAQAKGISAQCYGIGAPAHAPCHRIGAPTPTFIASSRFRCVRGERAIQRAPNLHGTCDQSTSPGDDAPRAPLCESYASSVCVAVVVVVVVGQAGWAAGRVCAPAVLCPAALHRAQPLLEGLGLALGHHRLSRGGHPRRYLLLLVPCKLALLCLVRPRPRPPPDSCGLGAIVCPLACGVVARAVPLRQALGATACCSGIGSATQRRLALRHRQRDAPTPHKSAHRVGVGARTFQELVGGRRLRLRRCVPATCTRPLA